MAMSSNIFSSRQEEVQVTSKFVATHSKLFQGLLPKQIAPLQEHDRFFSERLDLKVDRPYLRSQLERISKDVYLGNFKPLLNTLFQVCIKYIHSAKYQDVEKAHALDTLSILISRVLVKNPTGWEANGRNLLNPSIIFWETINVLVKFPSTGDGFHNTQCVAAPIRHKALQLGLTYMCSTAQLSTGAYFLRLDFFPSITSLVKSQEMEEYTFEAMLFLSILANYHKSDAANLNPYLKRIRECTDGDFMRKLCWATNFALVASIKAYQEVDDESTSLTLTSSLNSVITRLRPTRALSFTQGSLPRDKFRNMPIEACVILLPTYEFLRPNPLFASVLMEDLVLPFDSMQTTPLFCTFVSLASYHCTHASSSASPRSIAYANLSLHAILCLVENNMVMEFVTQTDVPVIRLCRQRLPALPPPRRSTQPPICSILDCCVLWLRHNLHKHLEVNSYKNCIWTCHRIVWFLQSKNLRLDYHWSELWASLFGLLGFLAAKIDSLHTTGGVESLLSESLRFVDFALCSAESYLPSPRALHEFIYELVRLSSVLKKQKDLLKALVLPRQSSARPSFESEAVEDTLSHVLRISDYFEERIGTGIENATDAMRIVADEIEVNGLHITRELPNITPLQVISTWIPAWLLTMVLENASQDVLNFARIACGDVLALMP